MTERRHEPGVDHKERASTRYWRSPSGGWLQGCLTGDLMKLPVPFGMALAASCPAIRQVKQSTEVEIRRGDRRRTKPRGERR